MTLFDSQTFSRHRTLEEATSHEQQLSGRVCVVTGASSGIGKETALGLARLGATVVMVCRNRATGELARAEILRSTGQRSVHLLVADLSLQSSTRELAHAVRSAYTSLDVLVNNAGVLLSDRSVTAEGHETTFAVNYLAPFLLTSLLLDLMKRSAPSRIINLGSASHLRQIDFDDLQSERSYRPMRAYGQSKLGNILFTYELARRLEGSGVTANCVDPGLVRTNIVRDLRGPFRALIDVTSPFYRSPARGAQSVIWLALSKEVEQMTGRYFKDQQEIRSTAASYDAEIAGRLWTLSEQMTGLAPHPRATLRGTTASASGLRHQQPEREKP